MSERFFDFSAITFPDTVLLYSSTLLAAQPGAADSCLGCNHLLTTNLFGKASAFNLPAGPYKAYFHLTFGAFIWKATYTFQLTAAGIKRESVPVQ